MTCRTGAPSSTQIVEAAQDFAARWRENLPANRYPAERGVRTGHVRPHSGQSPSPMSRPKRRARSGGPGVGSAPLASGGSVGVMAPEGGEALRASLAVP